MQFMEMTASAISQLEGDETLVVFPIAAVEQHGPHMPTGTDTILCGAVAREMERQRTDKVLCLPVQWIGASAHHLRFGATLSLELQTYTDLLRETLDPLLETGFSRFLILNGHGGNVDPMRVAMRELQQEWPRCVLGGASYWSIAENEIATRLEGEDKQVGHACELETSLMMHLRPELVDEEAIASAIDYVSDQVEGVFVCRDMDQRTVAGATGRPDLASAEKGADLFAAIVQRVITAVDKLLEEPLLD